jgi:hypothetical protein
MGSGFFEATVKYDWPAGMMEVAFKDVGYTEFYKFNVDRGYNAKVLTGQFTYQYLYKTSSKCPCEVTGLQKGMPAWWSGALPPTVESNYNIPYWPQSLANDASLPSPTQTPITATKYFPNIDFKTVLPSGVVKSFVLSNGLWLDSAKKPVGFMLTSPDDQQRTFTITSLITAATGTLGLVVPTTNCPCRKLVDVVLSLDRSGSIDVNQWGLEFNFVKQLANSFEYGADGANLGVGNWNRDRWETIALSAGTSKASVLTAVNNMKCCDLSAGPTESCCCCSTPIGGGLYFGGKMLTVGRPRATKVLILLTDGCQNHIFVDKPVEQAISCGCSEAACATNLTCTGDITKWYQVVTTQMVPGTKVIVVGVGDSTTICRAQLELAAGNDPLNVFNPTSWEELQTIVQTISATACDITATPCLQCCGLCTCGLCIPAPKCFNQDRCHVGVVDNATQCCRSDNLVCPSMPCQTNPCDKAIGCVPTPIQCKANDTCSYWYCNSSSVVCRQEKKPDNELPVGCKDVVVDQCLVNADCFAGDPCKTYECYKPAVDTPATCRISQVICPPSDNCTTRFCRPGLGCQNSTKTCTDNNNCTVDSCDPNVLGGCVFKSVALDCPVPEDPCKKSICNRDLGCIEIPVNCSERGYFASVANCTVPACNKTCFNQYVCIVPPPNGVENFPTTVVLASALGTAAIIGIVIAAAVLVVGLGGAAGVAIAGAAGAGGVALVAQNPIYAPSGASGTNALFKDQS